MSELTSFVELPNSLISSAVVLDWYDGPLRGIAHASCGRSFYFYVVAWDADYDNRLFALRPISSKLAEEFETALTIASTPRHGTDWMPTPVDDKSEEAVHARALEARLVATARPVAYLVLGEDIKGKVRVLGRAVGPETLFKAADQSSRVEDLASFLGVIG